MRLRSVLWAVVGCICFAGPARADVILIDPNAYAVGTDLSSSFPGVSLSILSQGGGTVYNPTRSAVVSGLDVYGAAVGSLTMGGGYGLSSYGGCYDASRQGRGSSACLDWGSALELRFDSPTNMIQIDAAWLSDGPGMMAYDIAGNEIARCWSPFAGAGDGGCASLLLPYNSHANLSSLTILRDHGDIARVVFGGVVGNSRATQVRYGVPEPTTLGLLALGLMAAGFAPRRRHPKGAPTRG